MLDQCKEILYIFRKNINQCNMDGPEECKAKWSKSSTERQVLYDLIYK